MTPRRRKTGGTENSDRLALRPVKVGAVQMSVSEDMGSNLRKAELMVSKAAAQGAEVVCLPELFAWRYFPSSRSSKPVPQTIPGPVSNALSSWARRDKVVLVGGSLYEVSGRRRYNTSMVFDENGRTLSKYRKVHLPQDDHYFEQDYFSPGSRYVVAKSGRGRVGTLICFDQWYPEPARAERLMGAEMIFYPTAIGWVEGVEPVEGDWKAAWEAVQVGHAISNSVVVCAVNRVGVEGGTKFWGGSFVADQFGKVLHRAGGGEETFVVTCNLALGEAVEEGWGFMRNRRGATYSRLAR